VRIIYTKEGEDKNMCKHIVEIYGMYLKKIYKEIE